MQLEQIVRVRRGHARQLFLPDAPYLRQRAFQGRAVLDDGNIVGKNRGLNSGQHLLGRQRIPAFTAQGRKGPRQQGFGFGLVRRVVRIPEPRGGAFARHMPGDGRGHEGEAARIDARLHAARRARGKEAAHRGGTVDLRPDAAVGNGHLRHPLGIVLEQIQTQPAQLFIVQLLPAGLGFEQDHVLAAQGTDVEDDGAAPGADLQGHADGGEMRVRIGAEDGRVAVHEIFAQAVHKTRAQRKEVGLPFPGEKARHVPDARKLQVLKLRAGFEGHAHAFAGGGVLAVRGLPAAHARGGHHGAGLEDVGLAAYAVEARGAGNAAIPDEVIRKHDAPHARDAGILEPGHQALGHQLAAAPLDLGRIELDVRQAALGHAFETAVRLVEKFAAKAFIVAHALGRTGEQGFHERLVAQAVEVVHKVFQPAVHSIGRQHGLKIAPGHGHEAAPVLRALVHNADLAARHQLGETVRGPQPGGAAAEDEQVSFHPVDFHSVFHARPPPSSTGTSGKVGGSTSRSGSTSMAPEGQARSQRKHVMQSSG